MTELGVYEDPNPPPELPLEVPAPPPVATKRATCQRCNDEFAPTPSSYIYCSDACRDEDVPE